MRVDSTGTFQLGRCQSVCVVCVWGGTTTAGAHGHTAPDWPEGLTSGERRAETSGPDYISCFNRSIGTRMIVPHRHDFIDST